LKVWKKQRATKWLLKQVVVFCLLPKVFLVCADNRVNKEIVALKEKYNFRLLVDDAHGFGTLGKTGAGAGEEQDCQDGIDVYFSFLQSRWLILVLLAADKDIIDYLKYNLRSQMFAKALPMIQTIG
jgi:glycine C-acetyltransferase